MADPLPFPIRRPLRPAALPPPWHRAIDRVTAATLDLQRARRTLDRSGRLDAATAAGFAAIEADLRRVAAALVAQRDGADRGDAPAC